MSPTNKLLQFSPPVEVLLLFTSETLPLPLNDMVLLLLPLLQLHPVLIGYAKGEVTKQVLPHLTTNGGVNALMRQRKKERRRKRRRWR